MSGKKILYSFTILTILFITSCTNLKYDVIPDSKAVYNSLMAKISFRSTEFKFSGKILLKYTKSRDKILLLSPINQVYYELFISKENTLLINSKKKKYWEGDFNTLFKRMGNINFKYRELKKLILEGDIPEKKIKKNNLTLFLEKEKKSGKPRNIKITGKDVFIKLKVSRIKNRKGKIRFLSDLSHLEKTDFDDVLAEKGKKEN